MTELSTAQSFVVRIYRTDTENPDKLTGLVETMDGSGERHSFTDIAGLSALLKRGAGKRGRRGEAGRVAVHQRDDNGARRRN